MGAECTNCGLNFEELDLEVSIKTLKDREVNGISEEGFHLHCPVCGQGQVVDWKPYQIFLWPPQTSDGETAKFFRWHTSRIEFKVVQDRHIAHIGKLRLVFPRDLVGAVDFGERQICYRSVPVFRELNKDGASAPALPVKHEFLDLVDLSKSHRAEPAGAGEYRFRFHLKIRDEAMEITLPVIRPEATRTSGGGDRPAFDGVYLALWPKLQYKSWRRYFLRFGCQEESLSALINPSRETTVMASLPHSSGRGTQWTVLDVATPDHRDRFACLDQRPGWVAIEFRDKLRDEVGGGLWRVGPADKNYPPTDKTIAIDFGTSNTCAAYLDSDDKQVKMLSIKGADDFIIQGANLPETVTGPDIWPPRRGFGKDQALLPTEILTREKIRNLWHREKKVEEWRPVVDYTIPTSGVTGQGGAGEGFHESDHLIADFKWQELIGDIWLRQQFVHLQEKYLELFLLTAMAQLGVEEQLSINVTVKFSYPLAFSDEDHTNFVGAIEQAIARVSQQTGLGLKLETARKRLPVDESRAAAQSASAPGSQDAACLYVDIGGGSTDIALLELESPGSMNGKYHYICSFKYAGGGLAAALADGGCLMIGNDIGDFRRKIREAASVTELMRAGTLFLSNKRTAITNKSAYFYSYLQQFLARLLAAHVIDKGRKTHPDSESGRERPIYRVLLYPLGNGWGFGRFIDDRYAQRVFCEGLSAAANVILNDAIDKSIVDPGIPRLEVSGQVVESPKSAVVSGLLHAQGDIKVKEPDWTWRTILGWTVQVGAAQKAEWFRPVTGGNAKAPDGVQGVNGNMRLACEKEEWPAFPDALPSPHDLNIDAIRRHLQKCSPTAVGQDWFLLSPFHIFLEEVFKPALKELI